ncbi:hypothetical protein [Mycobacterium sp. AT1]|uniref:hypothetical protein n=1 Tax=Mycobacterium sp. AT1 TaxID=1961706 RepID=UPI001E53DDA8|nr:hypothetical protein [Mycobacterium sp. AT1]
MKTVTILAAAIVISGCDAVSAIGNGGVSNPLTPEQSKAQVVDAAREVVTTLGLKAIQPAVWHASCNDQDDAPFRGQMMIGYPLAASPEASQAEIFDMVHRLESAGWSNDSGFSTHGTALKKDGVVVVFDPQSVADTTRGLEVFGECRDVTTTKDTKGGVDDVNLAPN